MKLSSRLTIGKPIAPRGLAALLGISLLLCAALTSAAPVVAEPDLLEAEKAFQVTARRVGDHTVELHYRIATGYYMYRDRFRLAINGTPLQLTRKAWPVGKLKNDATFGRVVTYRDSVRLLMPISSVKSASSAKGPESLTLTATSQGCADAGVCYPPLRQTIVLPLGSAWVEPHKVEVSGFSKERTPSAGLTGRLTSGK